MLQGRRPHDGQRKIDGSSLNAREVFRIEGNDEAIKWQKQALEMGYDDRKDEEQARRRLKLAQGRAAQKSTRLKG